MKTAENWLEYCAAEMNSAGVFFGHGTDNAGDEAAWMLLYVLGAPLDGSFEQWDTRLTRSQESRLKNLLDRRIYERCPLAYLTGEARFCGLDFIVSPDVLIPRSPLAELIPEQFSPWLQLAGEGRVLDMCTGGACIAIAIARHMPDCHVDAVDISAAALKVAGRNVARHAMEDNVNLIQSDLFSELGPGTYDLIVSNPPYVSEDVFGKLPAEYRVEPSGGLVCGEDGLDIVLKILDASPQYMKQQGILIVEVGESAETLLELLPQVPFLWLEFDHGGDGVFLLEYDQLIACQPDVCTLLEQRENV
ncbi:MAG: 50S ribosomal protein L3 N(5)-glutamine methyltransferase [Gammaproteobacteria bacterium]|nr:50S ribosomal protein L3 N(5)-glutamine methyltransferase [Gammaproteobacteria bacterium]